MSDHKPPPELPDDGVPRSEDEARRLRIVDDVVKKKLNKDFLPKPPNEIEILIGIRNQARTKVRTLLRPIVDAAVSRGNAHNDVARMQLLVTAHKFYIDELRKFNREEALFLLCLDYAERTVDEFV